MRPGSVPLDDFLARRAADRRLARLTHDVSLPEARGLEFGPGDNPTLLPEGLRVAFVDHAKDACAAMPGAAPIDHAWTGSGSLAALLGEKGFDFAIAAQVAQYVPNLLGWFRGIYEVLRPGGVLNLSLPDRRFMFDAGRRDSTLSELVEADLLRYERPSPRQVFAHAYEVRATSPEQLWSGEEPFRAPRLGGTDALARAHADAAQALSSGAYVACHCWVFTPRSFLDVAESASQVGLFPFVLNQLAPTAPGGFEFYVSMRRDAEEDRAALVDLQAGAFRHLRQIVERQRRIGSLIAKD